MRPMKSSPLNLRFKQQQQILWEIGIEMAGPGAYDFEPEYSNEELASISDLDVGVELNSA